MRSSTRRIRALTVFAMLGAVTIVSQIVMMSVSGIQVVGLLISAYTLTYRVRALIPIYVYVMLYCVFFGFSIWCVPYLYIWLPLWGIFMLVGKSPAERLPKRLKACIYMVLCGIYGLSFGTLYAPFQAIVMGWSFEMMIAWIIGGLPADITHAVTNFAMGVLIIPLSELLKKLEKNGLGY